MEHAVTGTLHHIEVWVPNLTRSEASWGWLLGELGYKPDHEWPEGKSWRAGPTYIVLEQSPHRVAGRHDRCRPGVNHLAFHVSSREGVDAFAENAPHYGWRLLYSDRHPHAGGPDHYAAYLEDRDGYEVELVAPAESFPGEQEGAREPPAVSPEPDAAGADPAPALEAPGGEPQPPAGGPQP
jgi:catechol 2,3-dioxygenase-like lactoylglutathione lyase family enzyme